MGNLRSSFKKKQSAPTESNVDTNCLLHSHGSETLQHGSRETFGCQPTSGVTTLGNRETTRKQDKGKIPQDSSEIAEIKKIREIRKQTGYLCSEVSRAKMELEFERAEENHFDAQLYLLDVEGYLETVPHKFQQTKEYEKLIKVYNLAKQQCTKDAEELIENGGFRNNYEGDSCRIH